MKKILLNLLFFILSFLSFAQTGQLSIDRITQMPDLPFPLEIRGWKVVATQYDAFVFDTTKTGQYLPLSAFGTTGQFNYPDNTPLFMDTYVGTIQHLNQAEAINIIPAVVGASLVGIDKSNQNDINWVAMTKDFFNAKNGQNVYLNNYSTTSGNDWWYDLMPNVYFYQLNALYPNATPEFDGQFYSVADRWLYAVNQLGGATTPWSIPNMNYRAFNLATGLPLTTGVPEPESAGSIAWLLYNAYLETNRRAYLEGAQLAMDFLDQFESNPSYELQLPYGTLIAARMNAVEGTDYPIQKLLDWCFDRGSLRGWGSIIGNWGGYDVAGLIGEANDNGNDYAFVMNGFQQVGALAPLPKYDKRYAADIAKWILNIANASRLFYWNELPPEHQDSYGWASIYDTNAVMPYEAMRQVVQGNSPFATGDAINGGWAATNLSLYSGSSVGYLASVISNTNVEGILQIDLNITDFYGDNAMPSYLYFNPFTSENLVELTLPDGSFGIYDAITEVVLNEQASGTVQVLIPAGEVRLIRIFEAGITPENIDGKLFIGDDVLDYHYDYNYSSNLRIKALSVEQRQVLINTEFTAFCEPGNVDSGEVDFEWFINDVQVISQNESQATLQSPSSPGFFTLRCRAVYEGQFAEDTLHLWAVENIPLPPVVNGIDAQLPYAIIGQPNVFTALVDPAVGEMLQYVWTSTAGEFGEPDGNSIIWQAPDNPTVETITVQVTNQDNLSTTVSISALVKDTSLAVKTPLIWYPFDNDNQNAAADRFHAIATGVTRTTDPRGAADLAYRFTAGSNIIFTPNDPDLNFEETLSISCWINCEQLGSERFILSHGSWQQRFKLSITPTGYLRWTVKTDAGVSDLDGSTPINLNQYYHVTALYTGYSMELYVNGSLDSFKSFEGYLQSSDKPLTIGRMDEVETLYSWRGSIDEVKLWDSEIPVKQIEALKEQWLTPFGLSEFENIAIIYPNPAQDRINIEITGVNKVEDITLYSVKGVAIANYRGFLSNPVQISLPDVPEGIMVIRMLLSDGNIVTGKLMIRK